MPAPVAGNFNQNITPMNARRWTQQFQIWVTPWGFLKGAAANNATVKAERVGGTQYNVVTWSPAAKAPSGQPYRVVGYINPQNMVDRVETWVGTSGHGRPARRHDLQPTTRISAGVKVPTRIVQKQGELESFNATITAASANPTNIVDLLTPRRRGSWRRTGRRAWSRSATCAAASRVREDG